MLRESGGLTAGELAKRLGIDERDAARQLFAAHGTFRCDRGQPPRWWLAFRGDEHEASCRPARAALPSAKRHDVSAPIASTRTEMARTEMARTEMTLYAWQRDALSAWNAARRRGVIEAVTGAGKTRVGVAATLEELEARGQVLVLVPTVELMDQWVTQLEAATAGRLVVGRMGGGHMDNLASHEVLVSVVNSARSLDVRPIRRGGLLVADECHRYGSAVNRLALDERFSARLGLSATYARDDEGTLAWLDPYFGGTCFRLGYRRAIADQVTAGFRVVLAGARLGEGEQQLYDELTAQLAGFRARLIAGEHVPPEPFDAFLRALIALAQGNGPGSGLARAYRQAMLERRRLLADTPAKDVCLRAMAPALNEAERAIVFTQSITTAERAAGLLSRCGMWIEAFHSGLDALERRAVLQRFSTGTTRVLAAPRLLDEGIDVPAAEVAVILGASRSRRQMIQRMGRVLRRKPDRRLARFGIVFVENTVEDPRLGAHEAFLEEVLDVADALSLFDAAALAEKPDLLAASLRSAASSATE